MNYPPSNVPFMTRPRHPAPPHPARTANNRASSRGFTLVELLTVISIIAILMSILIPTLGAVKITARKSMSLGNLKAIGHALILYSQDNNDLLPAPIYGESNVPGDAPGSANPFQSTWMEELVPYVGSPGDVLHAAGSSAVTITHWPDVLTDPQYLAINSVISDPDTRGYGMITKPYLGDKTLANATTTYPTQRQQLSKIHNKSGTIIVGTSNSVTMEPDDSGTFEKNGTEYANGDPSRYQGFGLFLFLDDSVEPMTAYDLQKTLGASQNNN